jgi:hypothetical protein
MMLEKANENQKLNQSTVVLGASYIHKKLVALSFQF